jgi:hypothetical protein
MPLLLALDLFATALAGGWILDVLIGAPIPS